MTDNFDEIRQWRGLRQGLVNKIADNTLENTTYATTANTTLSESLDELLVKELGFETAVNDKNFNRDSADDYGGTDDDVSSFVMAPQQLRIDSASQQLSISSSMDTLAGQAIVIKRTVSKTYLCFKDNDNGVMALNEDELVFVDCVLHRDGTGQLKMRIASINNSIIEADEEETNTEDPYQSGFRTVSFPAEIENMRAADIEYAPCRSAYIIGLYSQRYSKEEARPLRTSSLYLFNSAENVFDQWMSLSNPRENHGTVNRICCCIGKPVIYLIINDFGKSSLLLLDQWASILDRKYASDIIPEPVKACFVDIACTSNNDLLAIAYNSSTNNLEGRFGVRLCNPATWVRMYTIDLGLISVPFTVPRLVWLNQHDMFALVNQLNGQLYVFDRKGDILGQRPFIVDVEKFDPPSVHPINICAAARNLVAIRYTRFINIHRVND